MSESPRHADPAKRLAEIKYELSKPVQSQFIKSDCEWLVSRVTDLEAQVREAEAEAKAHYEEHILVSTHSAIVGRLVAEAEGLYAATAEHLRHSQAQVAALKERNAALGHGRTEWPEVDGLRRQVAALTQERDAAQRMADHMVTLKGDNAWAAANAERERAEAAEAALATTRQALTEIAALHDRWDQAGPDNPFDSTEAFWDGIDIARRALAATEETA